MCASALTSPRAALPLVSFLELAELARARTSAGSRASKAKRIRRQGKRWNTTPERVCAGGCG
eukprot:5746184-Pyramimonas_sp.AAC.1